MIEDKLKELAMERQQEQQQAKASYYNYSD